MQIVGTDFRSAAVQSRTEWIYFRGILGGPDSIQFDGGSGVWENYKKNWRTMIPEGRGSSWSMLMQNLFALLFGPSLLKSYLPHRFVDLVTITSTQRRFYWAKDP